jgi:hypothetical protein
MSDDINTIDKIVEEVLIDLMIERAMYASIQTSSMRGVQASSSTTHRDG